jgi:uncharacterized protein (TIGR02271 family)
MTASTRSTAVGVFADQRHAQKAAQELKDAGFREDQIGVVAQAKDNSATGTGTEEHGSHVVSGAVTGVAAGAGIGALWCLGIVTLGIPAIGPVIAGGVFAAILASAAGGAAIAGIVGALIGLGIPEEEAHYYEGEFKSGRTLVTVKADNRYDEAWNILHRNGAYNKTTPALTIGASTSGARQTAGAAAYGKTATTGSARTEGGQTMKVHEEQLHANKQNVKAGEVRVHKEVATENKTFNVPVTREEVVVERRPASGRGGKVGDLRDGEEIRIPVMEEKVHLDKETALKEEVHVGKRKVQESEQVSGDVRKEKVKVEQTGDANVRNKGDSPRK